MVLGLKLLKTWLMSLCPGSAMLMADKVFVMKKSFERIQVLVHA